MAQIEVTDPNASGNTAQKIKRVRGFANPNDPNTAMVGVVLTDATTGLPYDATSGSSGTTYTASYGNTTANLTSVGASTSSVSMLPANANRRVLVIVNDSASATLYVAFAGSSSASLYTFALTPGSTYEMGVSFYAGQVFGIWSAAVGNARITEITP
jgi:hypothetical protein